MSEHKIVQNRQRAGPSASERYESTFPFKFHSLPRPGAGCVTCLSFSSLVWKGGTNACLLGLSWKRHTLRQRQNPVPLPPLQPSVMEPAVCSPDPRRLSFPCLPNASSANSSQMSPSPDIAVYQRELLRCFTKVTRPVGVGGGGMHMKWPFVLNYNSHSIKAHLLKYSSAGFNIFTKMYNPHH